MHQSLTPREIDCMHEMCRLGRCKLVADELGISLHTVNQRVLSARRKLGAPNIVVACVKWAAKHGLDVS